MLSSRPRSHPRVFYLEKNQHFQLFKWIGLTHMSYVHGDFEATDQERSQVGRTHRTFGPETVSVLPEWEPRPGNSVQTNRVKRSEQGTRTSSSPPTGCLDSANHRSIPRPALAHGSMAGWGGCWHLLLGVALRQSWSDTGRGPAQRRCSAEVC